MFEQVGAAVTKRQRVTRVAFGLLAIAMLSQAVICPGQSADDPDQAQDRLEWMRENQQGMWNISPREGLYLYNLINKRHLKHGLEIGTSNGYSSIWIASAMQTTGGHLLTLEIDEERAQLAHENFQAAGVESAVTLEHADALEEIPRLKGPFDFVFIDAAKSDYVRYLELVMPLVPANGVIVAHNVKDMASALQAFIKKVKTDPKLKTTIVDPGPGGFSVSIKRSSN